MKWRQMENGSEVWHISVLFGRIYMREKITVIDI